MNTTTNLNYSTIDHSSNVVTALRKLFSSLFAAAPQQNKENETIWWLNSMANDADSHSPNLSAELRYIAARFG